MRNTDIKILLNKEGVYGFKFEHYTIYLMKYLQSGSTYDNMHLREDCIEYMLANHPFSTPWIRDVYPIPEVVEYDNLEDLAKTIINSRKRLGY